MKLNVIIEIIDFIKNELNSKPIVTGYENLISVLKKIAGNPVKDHTDELEEVRSSLIRTLKESEPSDWAYSKYKLFLDIDRDCIIGQRAVQKLNSIFDSNLANPIGISKEIKKILNNTNRVLKTNPDTLDFLSSFSKSKTSNTEKTLLTLFFEGTTSVNTINDIERYSRIWDNIIRDFALLTMQTDCESFIESIDKDSMVLCIKNGDKILEYLSYGTGKIIETFSTILRIRKIQLEAVQMTLNSEINEMLEAEVLNTTNSISRMAVTEMMEMNNRNDQDQNEEVFRTVQKSLKLILDFIEKGGKIECQITRNSQEIYQRNQLLLTAYRLVNEIGEIKKEITLNNVMAAESPCLNQ